MRLYKPRDYRREIADSTVFIANRCSLERRNRVDVLLTLHIRRDILLDFVTLGIGKRIVESRAVSTSTDACV